MTELRAPGKRDITLGAVTHNAGTEAKYRQALAKAIANMTASYEWWIGSKYRAALTANEAAGRLPEPDMALDAKGPSGKADDLFGELNRLRAYWTDHFDKLAKKLAEQTTWQWYRDNEIAWGGKLKRAGFDIKMQLTASQKLILKAKVPENVALIRSIQQDYHKDVEGIVTRSFVKGRDLATMADEIKARGGVSTRRAAFIARDQSNKATAQMNSARQKDLGLVWAVWIHSSAGKEPRHSHVKAGREQWVFNTQQGVDFGDSFGHVLPGEAINCFPGDSNVDFAAGCVRLWRRRYSGKLAVITTAAGKTFRATPNHPILTRRGWIAASSLNLGDDVIRVGQQVRDSVEMDVQDRVTRFDELFGAAALYVAPVSVAGAAAQFHGDGADGQVDVVDIDRFLPDRLNAARCKQLAEFLFADTDAMVYASMFGADGALLQALQGMTVAPEFVIRGASALLPLLKRGISGTDETGLRLVAWLYAVIDQAFADDSPRDFVSFAQFQFTSSGQVSCNDLLVGQLMNVLARGAICWQLDATSADELADRLHVEPDDLSSLFGAAAFGQELDRVVDLSWVDFDGHVYNLENDRNWYSVAACIVHNCRCTSRTIIPAIGRGDIESEDDLDAVTGFPGAYKAKPGKSVGPKMKQDVTKTRLPGQPVKYS